jgi:hypothetical protein
LQLKQVSPSFHWPTPTFATHLPSGEALEFRICGMQLLPGFPELPEKSSGWRDLAWNLSILGYIYIVFYSGITV